LKGNGDFVLTKAVPVNHTTIIRNHSIPWIWKAGWSAFLYFFLLFIFFYFPFPDRDRISIKKWKFKNNRLNDDYCFFFWFSCFRDS
jgi:hypothetical protein